jgi:hypothetical protein
MTIERKGSCILDGIEPLPHSPTQAAAEIKLKGCGNAKGEDMTDYLADVKKYDNSADEAIVAKIVRHLGIALRNRDSSLVSATDKTELDRVKEKWCGKKLGVTGAAADDAVAAVCTTMAGDRAKSRVTFYYLVAKELGKLDTL